MNLVNIKKHSTQIKTVSEIGSGDEINFTLQYCDGENYIYSFRGLVTVHLADPMFASIWKYDCGHKEKIRMPSLTESDKIWTFAWKDYSLFTEVNEVRIISDDPDCPMDLSWEFTDL